MKGENAPMVAYIQLKLLPELKALIDSAADDVPTGGGGRGIPSNEWVARLIAEHFKQPALGKVPRKRLGRKPQPIA